MTTQPPFTKPRRKWLHSEALEVASELIQLLKPFCMPDRLYVVGSVRRLRPLVHDVELLFVPRLEADCSDMFAVTAIDTADRCCDELLETGVIEKRPNVNGHFTWGEQNKLAIHKATGIPVDLFSVPDANWWNSLVIRTGPKELNLKLTTGAQARGLRLHAYGCGVTNLATNEVTCSTSEQHVFELCGVPYEPPERR